MSHWNDEWNQEDVLRNYEVLSFVEPEDMNQLVKDSLILKSLSQYLKDEYPAIYADLILKNIVR